MHDFWLLLPNFNFSKGDWALAYVINQIWGFLCPNTEFFLVCIFPHSHWIRRDTECLSVFSPNAGKYGPEKTSYLDTFHAFSIYFSNSLHMNDTKWNFTKLKLNKKGSIILYYIIKPILSKLSHYKYIILYIKKRFCY